MSDLDPELELDDVDVDAGDLDFLDAGDGAGDVAGVADADFPAADDSDPEADEPQFGSIIKGRDGRLITGVTGPIPPGYSYVGPG
jgi:hypothetical protein